MPCPAVPEWVLPNVPLHVIQRGNNRQACFFAAEDYRCYFDWLVESAGRAGCEVHACVLMTNHVHLLISADRAGSAGALMKALGQRYVQYANRTYRRSGTLWAGRFRSCPVQEEGYLLACHRYIELNPVRAGMVAHPADYRWSSYRANAQERLMPWSSHIRFTWRWAWMTLTGMRLTASCSVVSWSRAWWMKFDGQRMAILRWVMNPSCCRCQRSWGDG